MKPQERQKGIYVTLEDLIKLKYQAKGFNFLPRQPVNSLLAGRHASRLRGRGMNFEELRQYLPGDDIRSIDWNVTARTRKLHTRVFTEERERPVLLVVDQRITMFFGTRISMKSVTAAELAALGAWSVINVGDRVGSIIFNDSDSTIIKPHRSSSTVMNILSELKRYNTMLANDPDIHSNSAKLNSVLSEISRIATHDYLVCIVSDFFGMDEDTERIVKQISRHNDVIIAMIYDPIATNIPEGARFVVSDGTAQIEINVKSGKERREMASIFNDRLKSLKQGLNKFGVPVLPIHTGAPITNQLHQLLGQDKLIIGK